MFNSVLVWFRRDLRDDDQAALAEALRRAKGVYCAFIFDQAILAALPSRTDRRVEFIRESLLELDQTLRRRGGGLIVRQGMAADEIPRLAAALGVDAVFANRDYEPQAKVRDAHVAAQLSALGIGFETYKDQVVFEGAEVLTQAGRPYTVFTPYKNSWLKRLGDDDLVAHETGGGCLLADERATGVPALQSLGFLPTDLPALGIVPGQSGGRALLEDFRGRIADYQARRDYPAQNGCSGLSLHLRFGTVSIRRLVAMALTQGALRGEAGAACWLSELVWRDFYFMILDHFPQVATQAFKADYDAITWEQGASAEAAFTAWCQGRTGYPLVDAAMRQLNTTGFMHNRLRMVVASFLCKDLGLDWRQGEAYFAQHLNDFDLAANNGGWQWAASSGCDAQPYFRIFNPVTQSERFDPEGEFIRHYLPEIAPVPSRFIHAPWHMNETQQVLCGVIPGRDYPLPIVDHGVARLQTLSRYAVVKQPGAAG